MGLLSWRITAPYGWLAPWIISAMLFFAVLNMPPSAAAPRPKHLLLFVLQLAIGGTLYFILSAWDSRHRYDVSSCASSHQRLLLRER